MAKKRSQAEQEIIDRQQSRKESLRNRRLSEQNRQVRLGVMIVGGLIFVILILAGVNEWIIQPGRAVANVNGEEITLREWQDRVRYERAQLIILLENQLEAFGGDVGIIQQFAGQAISQLLDEEGFGQGILDAMVDEAIVRQAAADRGITVTEADIDAEIGTIYNFYDGGLPTPQPTATETIMPTPSLTPIPTQVITELLPTNTPFPTPTMGPTNTPAPTATAVSQDSFDEQYSEFIARFEGFNTSEALFRHSIAQSIYRERLTEAIAEEEELSTFAPHASYFNISFGTEAEANEALALIEADGYLTVWNTIRSLPFDPESTSTADASEIVWRTQDSIDTIAGSLIAETVFSIPVDSPSDLLIQEGEEGNTYTIVMVSGREDRELSETQVNQLKQARLASFLATELNVQQFFEVYNGRSPRTPVLDPLFLAPPTATPQLAIPEDGS